MGSGVFTGVWPTHWNYALHVSHTGIQLSISLPNFGVVNNPDGIQTQTRRSLKVGYEKHFGVKYVKVIPRTKRLVSVTLI